MNAFPSRGLYAITQTENKPSEQLIEEVAAAIRGGAAVIQYRDKNPAKAETTATQLVSLCHRNNIPLIINDDIQLALQVKADGVHLGRDDSGLIEARKQLGSTAIIGVSCYNSVERAFTAQKMGATYVAFGRFFPSGSKPLASPAEVDTLRQARKILTISIVAIGGILPENGGQLLSAGADLLAVIGGVFNGEPEQSAQAYQCLFEC